METRQIGSPSDTDLEIQKKVYQHLAELTPSQRLEKMLSFCDFARRISLDNLRKRYPEASERTLLELLSRES